MEKFVELLRTLLLDRKHDRYLKRFLKNALLVCPPVVAVFTFAFGGTDKFFTRFCAGYLIAFTVSLLAAGAGCIESIIVSLCSERGMKRL